LLTILALSLNLSTASATDLCAALTNQSADWPKITQNIDQHLDQKSASCGNATGMDGQVSRHCYWAFDYRSDKAKTAYRSLHKQFIACSRTQGDVQDEGVNHPDSYTLENFDFGAHNIALSLKDKATLNQTLIFVRLR